MSDHEQSLPFSFCHRAMRGKNFSSASGHKESVNGEKIIGFVDFKAT
jgi:hypothetical protein